MYTFSNSNFFGDFLIVMSPITLVFYIYKKILPLKIFLQMIMVMSFCVAMIFTFGYFITDMLHVKAITLANYANMGDAISTFDKVNKYNLSFPMSMYFKAIACLRRWQADEQQVATIAFEKLWTIAPNYVQSKCVVG